MQIEGLSSGWATAPIIKNNVLVKPDRPRLDQAAWLKAFQRLVRTFLFAGAENVLASAWRVDDAASAQLLGGLYRSLKSGGTSAAAVRDMKRGYLERVPAAFPERAHPYYWGVWMLWGTG